MSYITNPTAVTGALITLLNPGAEQNSASPVAVQIRNASGYVLTVTGSGPQSLIDPFNAATIPISIGQNVIVNPSFQAYPSLGPGYLTAEWLLTNEQPTEQDGPLTSAATVASITGTPTVEIAANQTVGISGIATVEINGTPTVDIAGTPTVAIAENQSIGIAGTPVVEIAANQNVGISGTPTVEIGNTPAVTVSGTATVDVNNTPVVEIAANQTVGISGTPTVEIGNTPAVTVSGTATVDVNNTPAVTVSGTPTVAIAENQSIAIAGTPVVEIAANQSVAISGTPTVDIGNTASVDIASGQVDIGTVSGNVDVNALGANVDSALYFNGAAVIAAGQTFETVILDVSKFNQLGCLVAEQIGNTGNIVVNFDWSTSGSFASVLTTGPTFGKAASTIQTMWNQPVIGPYLRIRIQNKAANSVTLTISVNGYVSPFQIDDALVIPQSWGGADPYVIFDYQNVSFAAAGGLAPSIYMPGRVKFWYQVNGSSDGSLGIQVWDLNSNTWDYLYNVGYGAEASLNPPIELQLPLSDWRMQWGGALNQFYGSMAKMRN